VFRPLRGLKQGVPSLYFLNGGFFMEREELEEEAITGPDYCGCSLRAPLIF
jgi:hypothetical protein